MQDMRDIMNSDSQLLAVIRSRIQKMNEDYKGVAKLKDISDAIIGCYAEKLSGYSLDKSLYNFKTL